MLYDVINYYQEQYLNVLGNYDDFNTSFSFSSLKDIHTYLINLPFDVVSRYESSMWINEFSNFELDYIEAISNNNNSFGASFLEEVLPGNVSYNYREGSVNVCTIDKEKERILFKKGGNPPPSFEDAKWYDENRVKVEWYESPEFYKSCHDSETGFSLPMPIYINAVNRKSTNGFFSLYDDLTIVSNFLHVLDDSSEASIKGFINDLSKLKGKVYFSYHDQHLMQVINAHATPYLETCYLHFFNIREPTPLIANNSDVKVCDAFSIQCRD